MCTPTKDDTSVALVAGVTGNIGLNLAKYLLSNKARRKWRIYGISRAYSSFLPEEVAHVSCDLESQSETKDKIGALSDITHVFYATWLNKKREEDNIQVNQAMLANLLNAIRAPVRHFVLVTGTKHYLGPFESLEGILAHGGLRTPFKESEPRTGYPNFYYNQEDLLFDWAKKTGLTWSVARPCSIIGFSPHNQMNLGTSIAVYASICKYKQMAFTFPGVRESLDIFRDVSDLDLVVDHLEWEAVTGAAHNQAFNVLNGDVFRWRRMWQVIAEYFSLDTGEYPGEPMSMEDFVSSHVDVWDEITDKFGLQRFRLDTLMSGWYVNAILGSKVSIVSDMNKSRELGYLQCQDTEKSFCKLFDYLRSIKIIP